MSPTEKIIVTFFVVISLLCVIPLHRDVHQKTRTQGDTTQTKIKIK